MNTTPDTRQLSLPLIVLLIGLFFVTPARAEADQDNGTQNISPKKQVQTECPVMVGNKIDPNIFTVYQDKKVFFCCEFCKKAFEKNPDKYLHRLPQFASVTADGHPGHKHPNGWGFLVHLIEPMGIITLSLVGLTVAMGLLRRRWNPRLMLKIHKTCGVLALATGATHAALVIFLH